jgi:hypothetical protein
MDANDLAICITSGSPIPKDCLSADIVSQIQQGGLISKILLMLMTVLLKKSAKKISYRLVSDF